MGSSQIAPLRMLRRAGSGEPEIKLALSHLSAEIKDRLNKASSEHSADFFVSAVRALSEIKGAAHADARMTCLFDCVCFFYTNDVHSMALPAVRLLDALAKQAQIKQWIRKAESAGAVIYADLGNVAEAITRLSSALGIAREIGDLAGEIAALNNLSAALIYGGLYKDAIRCCERAAHLARSNPEVPLVVEWSMELTALNNMAQGYYYLGDHEAGHRVITRCLSMSSEPTNAFAATNRSVREFTYVLLALELGRVAAARAHADLCREYAQRAGLRARATAEIAVGLCEVYSGHWDRGLSILELSLQQNGHPGSLRTDALLALVKALDQIGQPGRALTYIREVLHQIKGAREKAAFVLLSDGDVPEISSARTSFELDDLAAIKLTEATLRARAAEHEVIGTRIETLERLAITADLKEEASGEHGYRVGRLSRVLAKDLGWPPDECHALELAARLHDIGKIGLPDSILLKSTGLMEAERHFLTAHTAVGAEILSKSGMPLFRLAEEVARFHHECWDGNGYPAKLSGNRIPIHARIVALADVFDALTHGRPYAEPWSQDRALEEIHNRKGTQFDPELTERFLARIGPLCSKHPDVGVFLGEGSSSSAFAQARNNIRRLLSKESQGVSSTLSAQLA
jgi:putative two-component system response regulator